MSMEAAEKVLNQVFEVDCSLLQRKGPTVLSRSRILLCQECLQVFLSTTQLEEHARTCPLLSTASEKDFD